VKDLRTTGYLIAIFLLRSIFVTNITLLDFPGLCQFECISKVAASVRQC